MSENDKITVIGPDDMGIIEPDDIDEPADGFIGPLAKLDLKLLRSKKAVEIIMSMPPVKALSFIDDQMAAVTLLVNEEVLRWLTVLSTSADKKERAEAAVHINNLVAAAAKITETKIKLFQAVGLDRLKGLRPEAEPANPTGKPKLFDKKGEDITEEEFLKRYGHMIPVDPTPASV